MNMLCGMKYDKEKGCPEGANIFGIMYLSRNYAEGAKKKIEKKFWSPPLWTSKKFGPAAVSLSVNIHR